MDPQTLVGGLAAICTTLSYFPQLKKCWVTGGTSDLSLKMLLLLAAGLSLWLAYGFMRSDVLIMIANGVSLSLLGGVIYFKMREIRTGRLSRREPRLSEDLTG